MPHQSSTSQNRRESGHDHHDGQEHDAHVVLPTETCSYSLKEVDVDAREDEEAEGGDGGDDGEDEGGDDQALALLATP